MAERTILHLDMNAFFASVEQRANPGLQGKPVLVCGNRHARTVVATASYEARAYGVKIAMTLPSALALCPQAILVDGDPAKYLDTFRRVVEILERYSPDIEIFSIDEAFVEITRTVERFGGSWQVACAIQRSVTDELGLPCSIGIGPNKLIAKLASSRKKPNGITWIAPEDLPAMLEELPIEELCGIGEKLTELLNAQGVFTCGELARVSVERLVARFGRCLGERLACLARGIDESPVIPSTRAEPFDCAQGSALSGVECAEPAKSMGHLQTLSHNTSDPALVQAVLLSLSEKAARRLRAAGCAGRTVTVTVREADFRTTSRQKTLDRFLDDGFEIYRVGCHLLETVAIAKPIRMLGISVSQLVYEERQPEWLPDVIRQRRLIEAMDRINDRFGEETVGRATRRLFHEPSRHYQLKRFTGNTILG